MSVNRSYRHTGNWRGAQRRRVLERDGYRCVRCGNPGTDGKGKGLVQAHVIPAAPGVPNDDANVLTMCAPCHRRFDAARQRAMRTSTR